MRRIHIESCLACKGAKAFFNSSGLEIICSSYFRRTESANQMPTIEPVVVRFSLRHADVSEPSPPD
jgi:hypothetical protein